MSTKLKAGVVANVSISSLQRDPHQPRKTFDQAGLQALSESLAVRIEVPLKVRHDGNKLIIVDGERRWRAAKLAKLKTVPVLLAELKDELEIGAAQLTTSEQREPLKPLDIAEFLQGLQERRKLSPNELSAALAGLGFASIRKNRPQELMRLLELPDWAKELLRKGAFDESHGQALVKAINFPAVLEEVKRSVKSGVEWKGSVTMREVAQYVENAFRSIGTDLNWQHGREEDRRVFPIKPCRSCEWYKKIGGREYCLNRERFDERQKEALLIKADRDAARTAVENDQAPAGSEQTDPTKVRPRKLKASADGIIALRRLRHETHLDLEHAKFDKTQCQTCQHRHLASFDGTTTGAAETCFHPPCHVEKERLGRRLQSRQAKMRDYLERWLRPIVLTHVDTRLSDVQIQAIALWLATGAVDAITAMWDGQMHEQAARVTAPFLRQYKLIDLPAIFAFADSQLQPTHWRELAGKAVAVLTQEQLRWLAITMAIDLEELPYAYRIDAEYLKMRRKSELLELAKSGGLETVAGLGVDELREVLLKDDVRQQIGVPADLAALYSEAFTSPPDFDEADLGLDDDQEEGDDDSDET